MELLLCHVQVYEIYMDYIGCEPFRELSHYIATYEVYVSLAILE